MAQPAMVLGAPDAALVVNDVPFVDITLVNSSVRYWSSQEIATYERRLKRFNRIRFLIPVLKILPRTLIQRLRVSLVPPLNRNVSIYGCSFSTPPGRHG